MKSSIPFSIFLFALPTLAFASYAPMQPDAVIASKRLYVGVFGGGGSSNHLKSTQFGTAFFPVASGGPLAVHAFGRLKHRSGPFFGAQLGYQAQGIDLCSSWTLGPAVELEGYHINRRSFTGDFINETTRLPEHDFLVTLKMRRTVFLANVVVNFNNSCSPVFPYIGLGIDNAIIRISDAKSKQVSPPESGVNHFNASTSDTMSTFAGQIKLGLNYDISECVSIFAEYRWLYLANTRFVFGSTVYPTHAVTSSWQVKLNGQKHNMGNVGIRYNW